MDNTIDSLERVWSYALDSAAVMSKLAPKVFLDLKSHNKIR